MYVAVVSPGISGGAITASGDDVPLTLTGTSAVSLPNDILMVISGITMDLLVSGWSNPRRLRPVRAAEVAPFCRFQISVACEIMPLSTKTSTLRLLERAMFRIM